MPSTFVFLPALFNRTAVVVACGLIAAGCASVAVTDDAIRKSTATALHLQQSAVTISDRENEGVKSTYVATTMAGKKYACYVTGGVGITGRVVSDAICSEINASNAAAGAASSPSFKDAPCNALWKAAGRC